MSKHTPVREPVAWVERWCGSGPDRGWWVWEAGLTHGNSVAYIGEGDFAERLTSLIVEKHNAAITRPLPAAPALPECWKLVPVEPTQEMLDAFKHRYKEGDFWRERIHGAVAAMLAAAPEQKGGAG